jgi:ATP-dependent Lhr-like helicase
LIELWSEGFVEPIVPPPRPWHILAQQLMALAMQEGGIERTEWLRCIRGVQAFGNMSSEQVDGLVQHMLDAGILWDDEGLLWLGKEGEETFGRKNFMELFSVFTSPPLFAVLHGRQELGYVDETSFLGKQDGPQILLLGGRAWLVNYVDWQRKRAYVEATELKGRSRWKGQGTGLGYRLSQSILRVLTDSEDRESWSSRAKDQISATRTEFPWLERDSTVALVGTDGRLTWWNFAGIRANATLANEFAQLTTCRVDHDSFSLTFESSVQLTDIQRALNELRQKPVGNLRPSVDDQAIEGLKFSECLPLTLAREMLEVRLLDSEAIHSVFALKLSCTRPTEDLG